MNWFEEIEATLRKDDTKRFKTAAKLINSLSGEQAKFALLLINQDLRGYLNMPEKQAHFIVSLKRAKKARNGGR